MYWNMHFNSLFIFLLEKSYFCCTSWFLHGCVCLCLLCVCFTNFSNCCHYNSSFAVIVMLLFAITHRRFSYHHKVFLFKALQDQGNAKKTKAAATGNKAKRKRIILNESSSEEDTASEGPENKQTRVKVQSSIGTGKTQPSYQDEGLCVGSQVKNTAMINNKNIPSCSKDDSSDGQDFEIIKEVKPSKPPNGHIKVSGEMLPVNSGTEQRLLTNSLRHQNTRFQQTSKKSLVQPVKNKSETVVNDHLSLGSSGGNQEKEINSGGPTKDNSGKALNERLDMSLNAGTPPSPASSPMGGCQAMLSESSQLNKSSSSFFVACVPSSNSFSESQSMVNSTAQVLYFSICCSCRAYFKLVMAYDSLKESKNYLF